MVVVARRICLQGSDGVNREVMNVCRICLRKVDVWSHAKTAGGRRICLQVDAVGDREDLVADLELEGAPLPGDEPPAAPSESEGGIDDVEPVPGRAPRVAVEPAAPTTDGSGAPADSFLAWVTPAGAVPGSAVPARPAAHML